MIETATQTLEAKENKINLTALEKGCDINQEIEKHLWADLIITQSPVYWFATPWIYKKFIDEVFTTGLVQQSLLMDDG